MTLLSDRLHTALIWFRILACVAALLAMVALLFMHRPVVHTITANTEFLQLTLTQPVRLGEFAVDLGVNDSLAGCARPKRVSVPPGTTLTGSRRTTRDTTYLVLENRAAPIELTCSQGSTRNVSQLVIDHDAQKDAQKDAELKDPLAERPFMMRVAGLGTLGEELRDHAVPQQVMPLRKATITTEAPEWFGNAYVRLGERTVDAGSRLILGKDQAGSAALGFLSMERGHFDVTLRYAGDLRVLLPWADDGQPVVVTPSALDALKAQAQWGWVLVVVPVLLALLDALDKALQRRAKTANPRADDGAAPAPPLSPLAVANPPGPAPAPTPGEATVAVEPPVDQPAPAVPPIPLVPRDSP